MNSFSFIIPVYDVEVNDLNYCIKSIQEQKIKNYEIIIINDGSKSVDIDNMCKKLIKEDKNIKYFYQENSGAAVARNLGLTKSTKDYIIFVDADDALVENAFNFNIENLNFDFLQLDYCFWNKNSENIFSLYKTMDLSYEKNNLISNVLFNPKEFSNFLIGSIWSKIFSRKFINENNIKFKPELRKAQDRMFMLDVLTNAKKIIYIPNLFYKYRVNNESICHKFNMKMLDYYYLLYQDIKEFCSINDIDVQYSKYVEYSIFNELLPLTICHIDNKSSYINKRKTFLKLYDDLDIKVAFKNLKINDFTTFASRIKYILIKNKCFYILNKLYFIKQKHERKNIFRKE